MIMRGREPGQAASWRAKAPFARRQLLAAVLLGLIGALPRFAQAHNEDRPLALRDVTLDQKLGAQVPLGLRFLDETGRTVSLSDYFGERPVILTLVYFRCQDLCPLTLDGLVRTLRALSFNIGNQFDVLTVSFDPQDNPALATAKKNDLISQYSRPQAASAWHFLTGEKAAIERLTQAVGFRADYNQQTTWFGHATGIMLLTPQGKIARYFYGIEFSPRDLRLGLIEAASERIGSPIDQLLLFCYHYDPTTGKYGIMITRVIRLAGVATVLLLGSFIFVMLRGERNRKLAPRDIGL